MVTCHILHLLLVHPDLSYPCLEFVRQPKNKTFMTLTRHFKITSLEHSAGRNRETGDNAWEKRDVFAPASSFDQWGSLQRKYRFGSQNIRAFLTWKVQSIAKNENLGSKTKPNQSSKLIVEIHHLASCRKKEGRDVLADLTRKLSEEKTSCSFTREYEPKFKIHIVSLVANY